MSIFATALVLGSLGSAVYFDIGDWTMENVILWAMWLALVMTFFAFVFPWRSSLLALGGVVLGVWGLVGLRHLIDTTIKRRRGPTEVSVDPLHRNEDIRSVDLDRPHTQKNSPATRAH
ncbi:hypothetical protein A5N83_11340 [Rhodococcus sp. 1139]|nr:hypothetical protein A5N83_11340 [Rhodococcus sp. 1139]